MTSGSDNQNNSSSELKLLRRAILISTILMIGMLLYLITNMTEQLSHVSADLQELRVLVSALDQKLSKVDNAGHASKPQPVKAAPTQAPKPAVESTPVVPVTSETKPDSSKPLVDSKPSTAPTKDSKESAKPAAVKSSPAPGPASAKPAPAKPAAAKPAPKPAAKAAPAKPAAKKK
jgi:outer membrane biosynthesis protein TonB